MAERNIEQTTVTDEAAEVQQVRPQTLPLDRVAEKVTRDGRRDSDEYLEETRVPFGGE